MINVVGTEDSGLAIVLILVCKVLGSGICHACRGILSIREAIHKSNTSVELESKD